MPRTTLNIEGPILRDLKRMQKKERKPLGRLVSELLSEALARSRLKAGPPERFRWITRPMGIRIDLTDKDAIWDALDRRGS